MAANLYLLIYDINPLYDVYYFYDNNVNTTYDGSTELEPSGQNIPDASQSLITPQKGVRIPAEALSSSNPYVIFYNTTLCFTMIHKETGTIGTNPISVIRYVLAVDNINSSFFANRVNTFAVVDIFNITSGVGKGYGIIANSSFNVNLQLSGSPVQNVFAFNAFANYVLVSWLPPVVIDGLQGYKIVFRDISTSELTTFENIASSPFLATLGANTTYDVNVYAIYNSGEIGAGEPLVSVTTSVFSIFPLEFLTALYNEIPLTQQTPTPLKFIGGGSLQRESDRTTLRVIETQTEYVRSNILKHPDIQQYNFKNYGDYVLFRMGRVQRNFALNHT